MKLILLLFIPVLAFSQTGASQISTRQTGTGNVIRNVQDKANDALNAADFKAVGDGSHDDCPNLQLAIAVALSSGKDLSINPGNFVCNTTASSGVLLNILLAGGCNPQTGTSKCQLTIKGAGHGSTFIKTTTGSVDMMAAIATGSLTYPVYHLSGFTLIGPDATHAGAVSGNGLRISGTGQSPAIQLNDIYVRNFYGTGKAAFWLDNANGMSLTDLRADISDIGFKLNGNSNSDSISSANNLQTSQAYSYGFTFDNVNAGSWNNLSSQGSVCNGFRLTRSSIVINGLYMEGNNTSASGSCHGLVLEGPQNGGVFNGVLSNTLADDIFLNGGGSTFDLNTSVFGNTFTPLNTIGGNQGPVTLNNKNSTGNQWVGWFGQKFTGAGNLGVERGAFSGCQYVLLADGATTVTGNSPCNLYQISNSGATLVTNLPDITNTAAYGDGLVVKIYVRDSNTTFTNAGGNLIINGGTYNPPPGRLVTFTSYRDSSEKWILSGN